jgi:prevent-host-death family protein
MISVSLAEARLQLSRLVEGASATQERYEITRNGERAAVVRGADDYDSLEETIGVLSDSTLLLEHLEGLEALERGDTLNVEQFDIRVRAARRLPVKK